MNISIDMARQYSSMKQQLLTQVTTLEQTIAQQAAAHTADRTAWQAERTEWMTAVKQREAAIDIERQHRDDMAVEFAAMLQKTLDKMGERLEVTNDWQADGSGSGGGGREPTVRTLEEFSIGSVRSGLARS